MLKQLTVLIALTFAAVVAFDLSAQTKAAKSSSSKIRFQPKKLTVDANEGVAVADINGDGKMDVVAGRNWYAAPEFVSRPLRSIADWNGYIQSNGDFTYDVNGDGHVDVIAGSFLPSKIFWYENPGNQALKWGQLWKQHLLVDTKQSQNEISFLRDLDGDGKPEWITNSWNRRNPILVWQLEKNNKKPTARRRLVGADGQGHGMGFGDINNDGREDILTATGWYERPVEKIWDKPWKFHQDWDLGSASCPVLVRDLNGDGKNDLIWGKGHDYGLYWWESSGQSKDDGKLKFKQHLIDDRFSQPHAIHLADLDGDGVDELISGKRVRAHNGNDPGGKDMPCMYYFRWDKARNQFHKHVIDEGHIGIGLQIRTGDLNNDQRIDIVVAGKDGTWILFNQGSEKRAADPR